MKFPRHDHPNDPDAPSWMVELAFLLILLPPLFVAVYLIIDGPQDPTEGTDWFYVEG